MRHSPGLVRVQRYLDLLGAEYEIESDDENIYLYNISVGKTTTRLTLGYYSGELTAEDNKRYYLQAWIYQPGNYYTPPDTDYVQLADANTVEEMMEHFMRVLHKELANYQNDLEAEQAEYLDWRNNNHECP
jgi:hypothetical protein